MRFHNRSEAGRMLARELTAFKGQDVIVLAIPMGGVPVGFEVAQEYHAPLDLIMAKKIGAPFNPELAVGAVTWNGAVLLDQDMMDRWQIRREYVDGEAHRISAELRARMDTLRSGLGDFQKLYGRTVIIVDDGIATGATMIAAVEAVRDQGPKDVVIATPVLPAELVDSLKSVATLVYVQAPDDFEAVGQYYEQFETLADDQVKEYILLANSA